MVTEQGLQQQRDNIKRIREAQRNYMTKKALRYAEIKDKHERAVMVRESCKEVWDD